MAIRLVNVDRETAMLFPIDLREWLPKNHLVHFIIDAIEMMDISAIKVNERGSGDEQYPPCMMLALLIYCYATKRMSSRVIEEATYSDIAVRYICGNTAHPDHSVICRFRTSNKDTFKEIFTKVLVMAQEMGHLKKVGGISVDGTKIHANASKHSSVSYKRATEMIAEIEKEVAELIAKADDADSKPLEEGLTIPAEIELREKRKAKLEEAKKEMENRYKEAAREKEEQKKEKSKTEDTSKEDTEKKVNTETDGSSKQKKASTGVKPLDKYQYNFTDPESRIMKAGNGQHFEQSYNAQAAVDVDSMLVVGKYVTNHPNDKKELEPVVNSVDSVYKVDNAAADTGFYSEAAVAAVEKRDENGNCTGTEVFCAVEKQYHHRTVQDLEKKDETEETKSEVTISEKEENKTIENKPDVTILENEKDETTENKPDATVSEKEKMRQKLKTEKGKAIYKKRKETVEPVFGIIKQAMGFRQFLLRGLERAGIEWDLVTASYNFKKLFSLSGRRDLPLRELWGN